MSILVTGSLSRVVEKDAQSAPHLPLSSLMRLPFLTNHMPQVWAPYYCIDKVMQGLLDQHAITGSPLAFQVAAAMADYIHARVEKHISATSIEQHWRSLDMEYGGLNNVLWQVIIA